MTTSTRAIRLVNGPPRLVGITVDVGSSPLDAADVDPTSRRFVRATDGHRVVPFSSLRPRCTHRAAAEELAATWRLLVFVPASRRRRAGVHPYRYEGAYLLTPERDETGRWGLSPAAPIGRTTSTPGPPAHVPAPTRTDGGAATGPVHGTWAELGAQAEDAAARVATLVALLPPGPLAERAADARGEVERAADEAGRLAAVGTAIEPVDGVDPRADALRARIDELVTEVDRTVDALVAVHLSLGDPLDPAAPLHGLAEALAELGAPTPPAHR
jgi:hypothetical protein